MTRHAARAERALAHLGEIDPAFAVLALWCRHRDTAGPTRTAGETVFYGPGFDLLPLQEQVGVAAHHVLHVALRHSPRAAALAERLGARFDPARFGLAADAIVNETLIAAGHALPRPCVTLQELLQAIGEPAPNAVAALAEWDADRLAMRLHRDAQTAELARDYGRSRAFAPDLDPHDEGEETRSRADWRGHVLRAVEAGRQAGTGLGTLGTLLADLAPQETPWEVHLRGLLARALADRPRPSHRRPANRWAAMESEARASGGPTPVFEPGRQRSAWRPRIVIGLDTSSSIDPLTLSLFAAEAAAIARRTGAEAHLLGFDETVHTERRLAADGWDMALSDLQMRQGGGTSFLDVLRRAGALAPSIAVILTDLEAPFGPPPAYPVLWAVPKPVAAPPFGRVLQIGDG